VEEKIVKPIVPVQAAPAVITESIIGTVVPRLQVTVREPVPGKESVKPVAEAPVEKKKLSPAPSNPDKNKEMNISNIISCTERNSSIYNRQKEYRILKGKQIEQMRTKKKEEENAMMRNMPELTDKTKMIISAKFSEDKPLFERYQDEMRIKKIKLDNLKKTIDEEKKFTVSPMNKTSDSNFDEWLNNNYSWLHKREAKRQYLKKEVKMENSDEELIFHPKIDETSNLIVK
jgi:hypothetical protein